MKLLVLSLLIVLIGLCSCLPAEFPSRSQAWQRHAHVTLTQNPKRFQLIEGPPPRNPLTGEVDQPVIAWAAYSNETYSTGWNYLQITGAQSKDWTDSDIVYAAGYLEGSLTRGLIMQYWSNTIGWDMTQFCGPDPTYCRKLNETLTANLRVMGENIVEHRPPEPYWHQVGLVLEQLSGLEDGYMEVTDGSPRLTVDPMGLYLLNLFGDLEDIQAMINVTSGGTLNAPIHPPRSLVEGSGRCSGLIKLLPDNKDIFVSHVAWNTYQSMIRLVKQYDLPVSVGTNVPEVVPGRKVSFSSYPGVIFSGDDFYILSSGLSVVETTLGNGNDELYAEAFANINNSVWEFIRNVVANRIAHTGQEWADMFKMRNSGTYNNQFMILDWKKFTPGSRDLQDGLLTIVEQIPMYVSVEDQTKVLRSQGYWPSYNLPSDPFIFNISGVAESVKQYGDWFSYDKHPRALMFKRDVGKVVDIASGVKLMRYNDFKHDPLARCETCDPPYSAENAISARSDLNDPHGKYAFSALEHRGHGGIDVKASTGSLAKNYEMVVQGGPTWDQVPVFDWTKSGDLQSLGHVGQPDVWKFNPIHVVW